MDRRSFSGAVGLVYKLQSRATRRTSRSNLVYVSRRNGSDYGGLPYGSSSRPCPQVIRGFALTLVPLAWKRQGIEECLGLCFISSSTSLSALKRSRDLLWETPLRARRTIRKNRSSGSTRGAGGPATVLLRGPRFSPWEGRPENLAISNGGNLQSSGCLHRNPNPGTKYFA